MKRQYMKPETEVSLLTFTPILANSVKWDVQQGEGGNKEDVDPSGEPDPSSGGGAKGFNLWDDWE